MRMPLIIGLPGVGKTRTSVLLGEQLGLEVISTDEQFRRYRAIPINENNPDDKVIMRFMTEVYHTLLQKKTIESPRTYEDLVGLVKKDPHDAQGRNGFYPSDVARSFGEDVFRTFEWVMNKWLKETGAFDDKIVDISSAALSYKQNREVFTPDKFKILHLVADDDVIIDNLLMDYRRHQKLSEQEGQIVPLRGAYEKVARDAVTAANGNDSDAVIRPALAVLSNAHKSRIELFNRVTEGVVIRERGQSFEAVAEAIRLSL